MISGSATNPKLTEQGFKTSSASSAATTSRARRSPSYLANELQAEDGRDHRRRHRLRRRPRQRGREDAQGGEDQGRCRARRAPTRPPTSRRSSPRSRAEARRGLLRRHGRHRRPAAQAGARARHQGGVRVRRRRLHRRDEQARRRRGRRAALLAGRHPAAGGVARSSSTRSRRSSTATRSCYAPFTYDARQHADRGDEEGGLDRPGQVPAGAAEDQLQRRHRARSRSTTRATARTPR